MPFIGLYALCICNIHVYVQIEFIKKVPLIFLFDKTLYFFFYSIEAFVYICSACTNYAPVICTYIMHITQLEGAHRYILLTSECFFFNGTI